MTAPLREVLEQTKDAPQVVVSALMVAGLDLQSWILVLTVLWAVFRLGNAVIDFYEKVAARRKAKHDQQSN